MSLAVSFPLVLPPPPLYSATCKDFGVVVHVRWGEGLGRNVGEPTTELVVTRRDEATLLAVQGVADCEGRPTDIKIG